MVSSISERLTDCWQFVFNYAFKDVLAGDEMSFGINPEAAADKSFELKPGLALLTAKIGKMYWSSRKIDSVMESWSQGGE